MVYDILLAQNAFFFFNIHQKPNDIGKDGYELMVNSKMHVHPS